MAIESDAANETPASAAYRKAASPLMFSLAVHAVVIVLCMTFGFATLVQQECPLFASPAESRTKRRRRVQRSEDRTDASSKMPNCRTSSRETDEFNIADNFAA